MHAAGKRAGAACRSTGCCGESNCAFVLAMFPPPKKINMAELATFHASMRSNLLPLQEGHTSLMALAESVLITYFLPGPIA